AKQVVEFNDKHAGKLKELVEQGNVAFKGLSDFVDVTGKDDDKHADGDAQKAMGTLVSELSEGQATVLEVAEKTVKAIAAMNQQIQDLQGKLTAEQDARKALEARLNAKPRRVDDAEAGNEVEGKEADEANDTLDKQQSGGEFDPQYPGMNIPLKKS